MEFRKNVITDFWVTIMLQQETFNFLKALTINKFNILIKTANADRKKAIRALQ